MRKLIEPGLIKPKPSQSEAKGDATTRAALEILNKEAAARVEKTERLRKARLAKEAVDAPRQVAMKIRRRSS